MEPARKAEVHSHAARLLGLNALAEDCMSSLDVQTLPDFPLDDQSDQRVHRAQPLVKLVPQSGLDLEPRSQLESPREPIAGA